MAMQTRTAKRRAYEVERLPQPQKRRRTGRQGRKSDGVVETAARGFEVDPVTACGPPRKTPAETIPPTAIIPAPKAPIKRQQTVDPKTVFPFRKLPAELRLNIYRMALVQSTPLNLQMTKPSSEILAAINEHRLQREAVANQHRDYSSARVEALDTGRALTSNWGGCSVDDEEEEHLLNSLVLSGKKVDNHGLVPEWLTFDREVYAEARQVLYADNMFVLQLDTGIYTLSQLRQRSRSLIQHVSLTIPSHHDILDGFADLVRLGMRYCWGLKSFTIILPSVFPEDRFMAGTTSVYANAFHILRWLPKDCKVKLEGSVHEQVRRVVEEEGRLQTELDETSYLKRQHQMPERH